MIVISNKSKTRVGFYETNSSSTHSLSIGKLKVIEPKPLVENGVLKVANLFEEPTCTRYGDITKFRCPDFASKVAFISASIQGLDMYCLEGVGLQNLTKGELVKFKLYLQDLLLAEIKCEYIRSITTCKSGVTSYFDSGDNFGLRSPDANGEVTKQSIRLQLLKLCRVAKEDGMEINYYSEYY